MVHANHPDQLSLIERLLIIYLLQWSFHYQSIICVYYYSQACYLLIMVRYIKRLLRYFINIGIFTIKIDHMIRRSHARRIVLGFICRIAHTLRGRLQNSKPGKTWETIPTLKNSPTQGWGSKRIRMVAQVLPGFEF